MLELLDSDDTDDVDLEELDLDDSELDEADDSELEDRVESELDDTDDSELDEIELWDDWLEDRVELLWLLGRAWVLLDPLDWLDTDWLLELELTVLWLDRDWDDDDSVEALDWLELVTPALVLLEVLKLDELVDMTAVLLVLGEEEDTDEEDLELELSSSISLTDTFVTAAEPEATVTNISSGSTEVGAAEDTKVPVELPWSTKVPPMATELVQTPLASVKSYCTL